MKVLHILGAPLQSGAGRGVLALHEGLLAAGVDSRIIGRVEKGLSQRFQATPVTAQQHVVAGIGNRISRWRFRRKNGPFPSSFSPLVRGLNLHKMRHYPDADIVHIQWVGAATLGPALWRALKAEQRPVVWTLRDMWPFTGGCHAAVNCMGFETGCGQCPMLGHGEETLVSKRDATFKADHINDNFTFVAMSRHMADQARSSKVLKHCDIRVIPNSVMFDRFKPVAKLEAREALGLSVGKFLLSAGALELAAPHKGGSTLAALLEAYRNDKRVHWAIFGRGIEQLVNTVPDNCTVFGQVDDDRKLNQIYAAADLFVMPSLQESFGKTTIEAMASGTPVIAYAKTPAEEMIKNGETGWLVAHGDTPAFLVQVKKASEADAKVLEEMGDLAHKDANERFSLDVVVSEHIRLYKDRLSICS